MSSVRTIITSTGLQDMYLTNMPQYTHLKSEYNKHTNFSKFILKVEPEGYNVDKYYFNDTIHFDIEKPADLLLNINLQIEVSGDHWNNASKIVPETMYALIDYIEITSNDKVLEKLTGDAIYLLHQLYDNNTKYIATMAYANNKTTRIYSDSNAPLPKFILNLPIPFWFCDKPGFSIPLWAIQHESIKINLKLKQFQEITTGSTESDFKINNIHLINEYIDVTEIEKKEFQEKPLEYIIEQVECMPPEQINLQQNTSSSKQIVNIKQSPLVNELFWVFRMNKPDQPESYFHFLHKVAGGGYGGTTTGSKYHTNNISISLNGNKITRKPTTFYTNVQRSENHNSSRPYNTELVPLVGDTTYGLGDIYCYSFGLKPNEIFPSGFLSFDKFNNITLDLEMNGNDTPRNLLLYIKKFNLIRIKNGHLELLVN